MNRFFLSLVLLLTSVTLSAQNEVLTNQTVLDMIELGFGDDVVVTKISTSQTDFSTSIQDLKALKEKGVSNDIIVAMMQANKENEDEDKKNEIAKSGIYFKDNGKLKKVFPTVFSGTKTSTLKAAFTYGIADAKMKSVMNNEHSNNIVQTNTPTFVFFFDRKEQTSFAASASNWWFTVASSPNEFVLANLKVKKGKRELETGTANLYAGNSIGINENDIIGFDIEAINDLEFKVTPKRPLEPGEYCFFYQGTIPQGGFNNQSVFDFSISDNCKIETRYKNGDKVWVMKNEKPRNYKISSTEIRKDGIYYMLEQRSSWDMLEYKETDCFSSKDEAINGEYVEDYKDYEHYEQPQ